MKPSVCNILYEKFIRVRIVAGSKVSQPLFTVRFPLKWDKCSLHEHYWMEQNDGANKTAPEIPTLKILKPIRLSVEWVQSELGVQCQRSASSSVTFESHTSHPRKSTPPTLDRVPKSLAHWLLLGLWSNTEAMKWKLSNRTLTEAVNKSDEFLIISRTSMCHPSYYIYIVISLPSRWKKATNIFIILQLSPGPRVFQAFCDMLHPIDCRVEEVVPYWLSTKFLFSSVPLMPS